MSDGARAVRRQAKVEVAEGFQQYSEDEQQKKSAREHFDARFEDFGAFVAKLERIAKRSARVTR